MQGEDVDHNSNRGGGAPIWNEERDELRRLFVRRWGSERVVARGRMHEPLGYPILVARHEGRLVGALSYEIRDGEMQAITVDAFERGLEPEVHCSRRQPTRLAAAAAGGCG